MFESRSSNPDNKEKKQCPKEPTLSKRDRRLLDRAVALAAESNFKQRHGCIVAKSGKILGSGINVSRNHPDLCPDPKTQSSTHAEHAALKSLRGVNLKGAVAYVARIYRNGEPAMSKPCERCTTLLRAAGVVKLTWTIDNSMDLSV